MRVVQDYPPNYDEIDARFGISKLPGVRPIFAHGQFIFNPFCIVVTTALREHEAVHCSRQGSDVLGWWRRYMDDDRFRFAEEIPAHAAEYHALVRQHGDNRANRRKALSLITQKLVSRLYCYDPPIAGQTARMALERCLAGVVELPTKVASASLPGPARI